MSESAPITSSAARGATAGDVRLNRFHVAALAFQRSKQLQNGARPRLDAAGHKPTRLALLEVMADLISWSVT